MAYVVAIDGTAGSGKGTVTKMVADKLGMINVDTGIIYRIITLDIINNNIDISDIEGIERLLEKDNIFISYDNNNQRAMLNGSDVTGEIRNNQVNALVSKVAGIRLVRERANVIIRNIAKDYMDKGISIIMEGRDITTVVFPDALVKIYMDASLEERANRRFKQNNELGIVSSYDEILSNIRSRDYDDMHHEFEALKRDKDAIYLDTTNIGIDEVVLKIIDIINYKLEKEVK